jgi:hypothetical protein
MTLLRYPQPRWPRPRGLGIEAAPLAPTTPASSGTPNSPPLRRGGRHQRVCGPTPIADLPAIDVGATDTAKPALLRDWSSLVQQGSICLCRPVLGHHLAKVRHADTVKWMAGRCGTLFRTPNIRATPPRMPVTAPRLLL